MAQSLPFLGVAVAATPSNFVNSQPLRSQQQPKTKEHSCFRAQKKVRWMMTSSQASAGLVTNDNADRVQPKLPANIRCYR